MNFCRPPRRRCRADAKSWCSLMSRRRSLLVVRTARGWCCHNITGMVAGHCQTRTLQIFWRLCCNDSFVTWRLNQIVLASTIHDGAWACTERSGTSLVVHLVDSTTAWFTKRSSQVLSHLGWRPAASKPAAPMHPGLRWLQTHIVVLCSESLS